MPVQNTYLPMLDDNAFVPMPPSAEPLRGSPRGLVLPWNFDALGLPDFVGEAELAWRYLVAVRHYGRWAAVRYTALASDILVEAHRTDRSRKVSFSTLNQSWVSPTQLLEIFVSAMKSLVRNGYFGANHDPAVQILWPAPKLLEHIDRAGYRTSDIPTIPAAKG